MDSEMFLNHSKHLLIVFCGLKISPIKMSKWTCLGEANLFMSTRILCGNTTKVCWINWYNKEAPSSSIHYGLYYPYWSPSSLYFVLTLQSVSQSVWHSMNSSVISLLPKAGKEHLRFLLSLLNNYKVFAKILAIHL